MTCRIGKMKLGHRRLGQNARNRWNSAVSEAPWQLIKNQQVAGPTPANDQDPRPADRKILQHEKRRGVPPKSAAARIVWIPVRIVFDKLRNAGKNPRNNLSSKRGAGSGTFGQSVIEARGRGRR